MKGDATLSANRDDFDPRPYPRVTERREPCPECHEICGWCSWYRFQARATGCGCPDYNRRRVKCEKAEALKGTQCGTCDGSGGVIVRREILAPSASESEASQEPAHD